MEGFAAAAVFRSADPVLMEIVGNKRKTLLFQHGTCGMLNMEPVDKEPEDETIEALKGKARDWNDLAAQLTDLAAKLANGRASALPADGRSDDGRGDPIQESSDDIGANEPFDLDCIPKGCERRKSKIEAQLAEIEARPESNIIIGGIKRAFGARH